MRKITLAGDGSEADARLKIFLRNADARYEADLLKILPEHKQRGHREERDAKKEARRRGRPRTRDPRTAQRPQHGAHVTVDEMGNRDGTQARGRTLDRLQDHARYASERFLSDLELTRGWAHPGRRFRDAGRRQQRRCLDR
jgi:hypothetical protein